MKHISAYIGNQEEQAFERFAWLPIYSSFNKRRIWFKKYIELHIYYDNTGKPPLKGMYWKFVYTVNEYDVYLIKKNKHATV